VARLFCSRAKFAREIVLGAAKKLSKIFCACFLNLKTKTRPNYIVFFTKLCPKTGKYFFKVCYRGRSLAMPGIYQRLHLVLLHFEMTGITGNAEFPILPAIYIQIK
jgi:hypothetical protein